ncbi:hypothetical protein ABH920_006427, partial [Catenulispora sp. EB89]
GGGEGTVSEAHLVKFSAVDNGPELLTTRHWPGLAVSSRTKPDHSSV